MTICVALPMGMMPRLKRKFSEMSFRWEEGQFLDICVPSGGIVTPYKLNLMIQEAQVGNPGPPFRFPIRIVHTHKQQMDEINETLYSSRINWSVMSRYVSTWQRAASALRGRLQL